MTKVSAEIIYKSKLDDTYSSHFRTLEFLKKIQPKTVLEIGAADGVLTKEIFSLGCDISTIEINPDFVKVIKKYCKEVYCQDVEEWSVDNYKKYDLILITDVIEHLKKPELVLQRLVSYLTPKGKLIISVPNVAHIWIRLNLLFGKFNYTERGILDKSHLKFFTKNTFEQMLQKSGWIIEKIEFVPLPINLIFYKLKRWHHHKKIYFINNLITQIGPTLLAYQFLAVCIPKNIER